MHLVGVVDERSDEAEGDHQHDRREPDRAKAIVEEVTGRHPCPPGPDGDRRLLDEVGEHGFGGLVDELAIGHGAAYRILGSKSAYATSAMRLPMTVAAPTTTVKPSSTG